MQFTCPNCNTVNTWKEECKGKTLRCPSCQQRFKAESATAIQEAEECSSMPVQTKSSNDGEVIQEEYQSNEVQEVVPVDEGPIDVLPVDWLEETSDISDLQFHEALRELAQSQHYVPTQRQRLVLALMFNTVDTYRDSWIKVLFGYALAPPFVIGCAVAAFGLVWVVHLASKAAAVVGLPIENVVYALPLLIFFWARATESLAKETAIAFDASPIHCFRLGRLDSILSFGAPAGTTSCLGVVFGFQLALLYFPSNHFFLDIHGTFGECFLLTVDNFCHGVFYDIFDIYDIHVGPEIKFNYWAASFFLYFRMAFDIFFVLHMYESYQRYRLRRLFADAPEGRPDVWEMSAWIRKFLSSKEAWPRRLFDECSFLAVVGKYLDGDLRAARDFAQCFAFVPVDPQVRRLFADRDGKSIFPTT